MFPDSNHKANHTSLNPEPTPQITNPLELWHLRLGHTSIANKLKHIPPLSTYTNYKTRVCVTCPMTKLPKLSFSLSTSRAAAPFDLVHIDIWDPYRVCTTSKYKYFLTLVDDHTKTTWVYLVEYYVNIKVINGK